MLDEIEELTGKLSNLVGHLEFEDALKHLHILLPLPFSPRLLLLATATGPIASTDFHAVWTKVVLLAVRAFARWIGCYTFIADVDGARLAFAEVARTALALIIDGADLRTEEGLTALPTWHFVGRFQRLGRGRRGSGVVGRWSGERASGIAREQGMRRLISGRGFGGIVVHRDITLWFVDEAAVGGVLGTLRSERQVVTWQSGERGIR